MCTGKIIWFIAYSSKRIYKAFLSLIPRVLISSNFRNSATEFRDCCQNLKLLTMSRHSTHVFPYILLNYTPYQNICTRLIVKVLEAFFSSRSNSRWPRTWKNRVAANLGLIYMRKEKNQMQYVMKQMHLNGIIIFDIMRVLILSNLYNWATEIRES